jgi:broad specificity phosphatase PhoE
MPRLILIKHAKPEIDANLPSHEWSLSPDGRRFSAVLAARLRAHSPRIVVSSTEPKAVQTAQIIAEALAIPAGVEPGLAEHDRSNVPMMKTRDFISSVANFFARPHQLVLGGETAAQARNRIVNAIDGLIDRHGSGDFAVVTHGTVLALFAAPLMETDAFELWREMGLPSYLVFDRPGMELVERCDRIEA